MVRVTRFKDYGLPADQLMHHGIKGQKWGVRNGPPYPIKEGQHSLREQTASGDKKAGGLLEAYAVAYLAALALSVTLAPLAVKKADERKSKEYEEDYYGQRKIKNLSDAPRIDPSSMSMDEHMKSINPDYPDMGATQNCMFCTTAMAMRMKGYDVQAEKCPDGWSSNNLKNTFNNFKSETPKAKSAAQLNNYLASQGDGAYGNLIVYWTGGGGHSMFYHVDNGQVNIYDTQANKKREIRELSGVTVMSAAEVVRLDNCEPTERVLGAIKAREEKQT